MLIVQPLIITTLDKKRAVELTTAPVEVFNVVKIILR
jgi:hypothetical protein